MGFVEELTGEIVDEPKDFVRLACATRWDLGLLALGAQVELREPHWAKLASSPKSSSAFWRWA